MLFQIFLFKQLTKRNGLLLVRPVCGTRALSNLSRNVTVGKRQNHCAQMAEVTQELSWIDFLQYTPPPSSPTATKAPTTANAEHDISVRVIQNNSDIEDNTPIPFTLPLTKHGNSSATLLVQLITQLVQAKPEEGDREEGRVEEEREEGAGGMQLVIVPTRTATSYFEGMHTHTRTANTTHARTQACEYQTCSNARHADTEHHPLHCCSFATTCSNDQHSHSHTLAHATCTRSLAHTRAHARRVCHGMAQ